MQTQEDRIAQLPPEEAQSRIIYELEKERVMYLLASYLRTRLHKIQKFALYLDLNEDTRTRLSEQASDYPDDE